MAVVVVDAVIERCVGVTANDVLQAPRMLSKYLL